MNNFQIEIFLLVQGTYEDCTQRNFLPDYHGCERNFFLNHLKTSGYYKSNYCLLLKCAL